MTISPSSTHLFCQRCGTSWLKTDSTGRYGFTSSTYKASDFTSPSIIEAAAESILTCPSCTSRDKDRALGDFSRYLEPSDPRIDPDGRDRESSQSGGDADVVHTPKEL